MLPISPFSAFYLTFIDSGDSGWGCPCLFLLHIHKVVYSPTVLCSTTGALCWEINGLAQGSLPVVIERGGNSIIHNQSSPSSTGYKPVSSSCIHGRSISLSWTIWFRMFGSIIHFLWFCTVSEPEHYGQISQNKHVQKVNSEVQYRRVCWLNFASWVSLWMYSSNTVTSVIIMANPNYKPELGSLKYR